MSPLKQAATDAARIAVAIEAVRLAGGCSVSFDVPFEVAETLTPTLGYLPGDDRGPNRVECVTGHSWLQWNGFVDGVSVTITTPLVGPVRFREAA